MKSANLELLPPCRLRHDKPNSMCNTPGQWIHLNFGLSESYKLHKITQKPFSVSVRRGREKRCRLFRKHAFLYKKVQGDSWRRNTSLNLIFKTAHIFWPMVKLQSDRHFPAYSAVTPSLPMQGSTETTVFPPFRIFNVIIYHRIKDGGLQGHSMGNKISMIVSSRSVSRKLLRFKQNTSITQGFYSLVL